MKSNAVLAALAIAALGLVEVSAAEESKSDTAVRCTMEAVVGSHLPKKVCSTAAEREALRRQAEQTMQNTRSLPSRDQAGAR